MNHLRRSGLVVLSAANVWDGIPMADQQLAAGLSRFVPVLYVDPPQSAATRIRTRGWSAALDRRGLRQLAPSLWRLSPEGLPGLSRPGIAAANAAWAAAQVRGAVRELGLPVLASIEANVLVPISGRIGEAMRVYWAQDDFVGMAALVGGRTGAYARADARLAAACDLAIAANPRVAEDLRSRGLQPLLIPFGCDAGHFARAASLAPAADAGRHRPQAVFMGHLGDRIDRCLLQRLADDGIRLLLVGPFHPRTDPAGFDGLLARDLVRWVGARDFAALPAYLAAADVGLVPYGLSRFNIGSFPLKTLEYLAAGLPVVSTPLPGVEWLASDDVRVADGPEAFSAAVRSVLGAGRTEADDRRRREFATAHSWDRRAAAFAEALGILEGDALAAGGAAA